MPRRKDIKRHKRTRRRCGRPLCKGTTVHLIVGEYVFDIAADRPIDRSINQCIRPSGET